MMKHIFLNGPLTEEARRARRGWRSEGGGFAGSVRAAPRLPRLRRNSVSLRHLKVRCKRPQRRITVTDLSSGTEISDIRGVYLIDQFGFTFDRVDDVQIFSTLSFS